MHVLFVTSELAPFTATGELGILSRGLPRALRELGHQVTVIAPFGAGIVPERYGLARRIRKLPVAVGGRSEEVGLLEGKFVQSDVPVFFVDHPVSFQPEEASEGQSTPVDQPLSAYLFCQAALGAVQDLDIEADVLHCLGWQCGFLPLLLHRTPPADLAGLPTLFTFGAATDGGLFDPSLLDALRLSYDLFTPEGIEFHGKASLLKAGLIHAEQLSVLSPSYAREIQDEEQGCGLQGLFAALGDRLHGILPGVDASVWDPQTDHRLAANYWSGDMEGKAECKRALQERLGLPARANLPLLLMTHPLEEAQGISLVLECLPKLVQRKLQLVFAGPAPAAVAQRLGEMVVNAPQVVAYTPELDIEQQHRLLAGADALLLPARSAPGGLQALRALRYGTVPLARAVGGLSDTVVDFDRQTRTGTGICFAALTADALLAAVDFLIELQQQPELWSALRENALRQLFPWQDAANKYLELYQRLLAS